MLRDTQCRACIGVRFSEQFSKAQLGGVRTMVRVRVRATFTVRVSVRLWVKVKARLIH